MIAVSHENIYRLFAFSSDGPQRCLVLELCAGGSLDGRLRRAAAAAAPAAAAVALTWEHRVRIAQQVARALVYLHSLVPPMIHRQEAIHTHAVAPILPAL